MRLNWLKSEGIGNFVALQGLSDWITADGRMKTTTAFSIFMKKKVILKLKMKQKTRLDSTKGI